MQQYLRKVRVTFPGGFTINPSGIVTPDELKVGFNVSGGIDGEANTASLELWNLSEAHRNAVGKELDKVTIEAGYVPPIGGGNLGIIFKGNLRDVEHSRQGQDIITKISCGDGDKAFRKATTSKTFPAGTPVKDVVEEIYNQLAKEGIDKGEMKFPKDIDSKKFKRPYTVCGACTTELNTLGRGKGFYWSVQNETFEVIPSDGFLGGVVLISAETGMRDVPTLTDNGVKVSTLLNPEIRPNRRVQIQSSVIEMNAEGGIYRVSERSHSGDNMDGDFKTDVHGEAVKGNKVDEGKKT